MSDDSVREQLSTLMDGELAPDSARFLSKRLGNDPDLAGTWERWHCLRDSLRQQGTLAPADFCAKVREAIDAEDGAMAPPVRASGRFWRGLAGGAIAAGVAVFALMLGSPVGLPDSTAPAMATLANVAPVTTSDLTPNWRLSPVSDRQSFVLAQPQLNDEFDRYFVEHGLANGSAGALGIVSYVPVVASPATRAETAQSESSGNVSR
ncbi:MAG TPA: sigma-E factor negative regulatory protein [Patescibacteria group bacterium]|nr:sigma-E factor negative regulatory protein [Patescibacteria group bacterium]